MQDTQDSQPDNRKNQLEKAISGLKKILAERDHVLFCFERTTYHKTLKNKFSTIGMGLRENRVNGVILLKRSYNLDLNISRRCVFYLVQRLRTLQAELEGLTSSDQAAPAPKPQ